MLVGSPACTVAERTGFAQSYSLRRSCTLTACKRRA